MTSLLTAFVLYQFDANLVWWSIWGAMLLINVIKEMK